MNSVLGAPTNSVSPLMRAERHHKLAPPPNGGGGVTKLPAYFQGT